MDMPIMHDSDRYDFVRDIGSGNFGVARLMRDKHTKELVAVKYIERGDKVSFVNSQNYLVAIIGVFSFLQLLFRRLVIYGGFNSVCSYLWLFWISFFISFLCFIFGNWYFLQINWLNQLVIYSLAAEKPEQEEWLVYTYSSLFFQQYIYIYIFLSYIVWSQRICSATKQRIFC